MKILSLFAFLITFSIFSDDKNIFKYAINDISLNANSYIKTLEKLKSEANLILAQLIASQFLKDYSSRSGISKSTNKILADFSKLNQNIEQALCRQRLETESLLKTLKEYYATLD